MNNIPDEYRNKNGIQITSAPGDKEANRRLSVIKQGNPGQLLTSGHKLTWEIAWGKRKCDK
jgi:hypothetical protein